MEWITLSLPRGRGICERNFVGVSGVMGAEDGGVVRSVWEGWGQKWGPFAGLLFRNRAYLPYMAYGAYESTLRSRLHNAR